MEIHKNVNICTKCLNLLLFDIWWDICWVNSYIKSDVDWNFPWLIDYWLINNTPLWFHWFCWFLGLYIFCIKAMVIKISLHTLISRWRHYDIKTRPMRQTNMESKRHDHCCVPQCTNDSRYDHNNTLSFHSFPSNSLMLLAATTTTSNTYAS